MLRHNQILPKQPKRVIILGANGFLASALTARFARNGTEVRAIGRNVIDLAANNAAEQLSRELKPDVPVVFLSAITPDKGKGIDPFLTNARFGAAVCKALEAVMPAHIVYIGSDAVYPLISGETNEKSCAEPTDLYGAAHLAREIMLKAAVRCPLAILRPTMIYGSGDTHNSYGANRFRRMARKDGRIALFGEGKETRDHMYIDDTVALIELVVRHRSEGLLNLVSGRSVTFADLAKMVASHFPKSIEIALMPGQTPITHRKYDATALHTAFPDFRLTPLEQGIAAAHAAGD